MEAAVDKPVLGSEDADAAPEPVPPPPPLEPLLAVSPPRVHDVHSNSARVEWEQAIITIPTSDDPLQQDVQQRFSYSVPHELQMQEVVLTGPPEGLLDERSVKLVEEDWRTVLEAPCCNAEVTALRPGRYYAVRICCTPVATAQDEHPVAFASHCSPLQLFRTEPTPPGPMQPPALSQRARNALKLKWALPDETGGEPILQYVLEMQPPPLGWESPPNPEGFFEVYSGDERSFKVVRLAPGVRYTFRIMAFNHLGPSPWSLCSAFSTQASVPAPPDPPVQVGCSSDSVALQWVAPADNGAAVSGYTLEVDDGRGGDFRLAYTGGGTSATVSGLQSGLPYRFRLQADNVEGRSYWSSPVVATTAATAPSVPVGLSMLGVSQTSVTLAWQAPLNSGGAPITGYEVQLQGKTRIAREVLGDDWLIIYDGPSTATTCSALQPGCAYMARVCARNPAGQGSFCAAIQFSTAPDVPGPPLVLETEVDSTSLLLKWQAPLHNGGALITNYRVEMRCSPLQANGQLDVASVEPQHSLALTPDFLTIYSGAECCVQVTDLMPGTTYEFRVMAINGQGGSEWSEIGSATTLPSVPLPPAPPGVSACSSHSLQLTWREPYGQGAPVTSYTVNMARLPAQRPAANGHCTARSVSAESDQSSADLEGENALTSSSNDTQQRLRYETVYTGPALSCEVRNLEPASSYSLRVRAHNLMGGSAWGSAITITTAAAAPGPPIALSVGAAGEGELHVSWSPPLRDNGASVQTYLLEMAAAGRGASGTAGSSSSKGSGPTTAGSNKSSVAQQWSRVWQGAETACSVSGLLPGRGYQFRVRASNAQGLGPWCEGVPGTTLASAPSAPGRTSVTQRTATSLKVRWTLPSEENGAAVTSYLLQYRPQEGEEPFTDAYSGVELATRISGLQANTSYELRVAARNRVGQGPWSETESAVTSLRPPPAPTAVAAESDPGPPIVLRVAWVAATAGPAAAEAVGYEVEALPCTAAAGSSSSGSSSLLRQQVGRVESAVLSGAAPGCTYTVHLRAVGAGGSGHSPWSDSVRVSTPSAVTAPATASAGDAGSSDVAAGAGADAGAAGKRKGAKKARRTSQKEPAASSVLQRRGSVQQGVAKVPKRKGLWLSVPPKVRRALIMMCWIVFWVAIVALFVVGVMDSKRTKGQGPQGSPTPPGRVPPPMH